MLTKAKEIWKLTTAKGQSVSMQRRLALYWVSMALSIFAVLVLLLSITGVFTNPAQKLAYMLTFQQQSAEAALTDQLSGLTAQCVTLSETVSKEISDTLTRRGADFDDLNDNVPLIEEVEGAMYNAVQAALRSGDCNGAFVTLDATVNTGLVNAPSSRMGLYLRYSDISTAGNANQRLVYFRGVSELARREQVQMHNRWNLEFDVTYIPGYDDLMAAPVARLAESGVWSERIHLKDTWEDVLTLYVPVLVGGEVRGLCGVEISELYFRLSYPHTDSDYGSMVTALAPLADGRLLLDKAMLGGAAGTRLEAEGMLSVREGKYYNIYSSETERYIGLHSPLDCTTAAGRALAVVTLLPEGAYQSYVAAGRTAWIAGSLVFLLCMLLLSLLLSRHFVKPITRSLQTMQAEPPSGETPACSGISEIDELMAFVRSKAAARNLAEGFLPPNIEELLQGFREKVRTLTPMEHTVLQFYIDGYTLKEIPALAFISLSTVKTHNTNINRKLCVSAREELMMYIDLFRRCGRLDEITYHS